MAAPISFRLLLFGIVLFSSFRISAARDQIFHRYTCLSDHLSLQGYEDTLRSDYTFDSAGHILSNQGFHPVLASIYALLAYDRFVESGDSSDWHRFSRQAEMLTDSHNYDLKFGGRGIGCAYRFTHQDKVAPWYSGMAQGLALSVLLRYIEATGRTDLNAHCRGLAYFLLQPEKEGGTMSSLPDGRPFIEEYPNSQYRRHVLNGAINAWIGLYEYSLTFPADFRAALRVRQLLDSFEHNLSSYAQPRWCRYDLGKASCSDSYLRYHVYQMEHLYTLTGRDAFLRQQAIWAAHYVNTRIRENAHLFARPRYQPALKAVENIDGWLLTRLPATPFYADHLHQVHIWSTNSKQVLAEAFGKDCQVSQLVQDRPRLKNFLIFHFPEHHREDLLRFFHPPRTDTAFCIFLIGDSGQFRVPPQKVQPISPTFSQIRLSGDVSDSGYLALVIATPEPIPVQRNSTMLRMYDTREFSPPLWGAYTTPAQPLQLARAYRIRVPRLGIDDLRIFYRHGKDKKALAKASFLHEFCLEEGELFFPGKSGLYQFLLTYRPGDMTGALGKPECAEVAIGS